MNGVVDTLKFANSSGEKYNLYPRTLIECISNKDGETLESLLQNQKGGTGGSANTICIKGSNLVTSLYKVASLPASALSGFNAIIGISASVSRGEQKTVTGYGLFALGTKGLVRIVGDGDNNIGVVGFAMSVKGNSPSDANLELIVGFRAYDNDEINQECTISITTFGEENPWATFDNGFVAIAEDEIGNTLVEQFGEEFFNNGFISMGTLTEYFENFYEDFEDFRVTCGQTDGETGAYATAEGIHTSAPGYAVHAEGELTTASGRTAHAEGYQTVANNLATHAENYRTQATGKYSHAEGDGVVASGESSHAEGMGTGASGYASHAEGVFTRASNLASHASGKYNKLMESGEQGNTTIGDVFVIGNGTSSNALSNAFRVTYTGETYGLSAFKSSGADYAEFVYPWHDDNVDNEDRVGYFVTFKDGKLYKATSKDIILGITSGNPSVVGNADEDYYWRYERDEFNRIVFEDVEEEIEKLDENGKPVCDENGQPIYEKTGNIIKNGRMKYNENYDSSLQNTYVERKDRAEWDYVGMLGILPTRDDGTCIPGQYCKCNDDGIATLATAEDVMTNRFTYIVLERVNDNVIKVRM